LFCDQPDSGTSEIEKFLPHAPAFLIWNVLQLVTNAKTDDICSVLQIVHDDDAMESRVKRAQEWFYGEVVLMIVLTVSKHEGNLREAVLDALDLARNPPKEWDELERLFSSSILDSRAWFRTKKTRAYGALYVEAQADDELWILHGLKVPALLRPCENGHYQFVGEAYVQGYMYGEALDIDGIEATGREIVLE
jgi:hypothetical protein